MITVGIIQILFGSFRLAKLMNFVSRPTVLGFLNGLAIIILLSQIHAFREVTTNTELTLTQKPETEAEGPTVEQIFSEKSLNSLPPMGYNNMSFSGGIYIADSWIDRNDSQIHLELSQNPTNISMIGLNEFTMFFLFQ